MGAYVSGTYPLSRSKKYKTLTALLPPFICLIARGLIGIAPSGLIAFPGGFRG